MKKSLNFEKFLENLEKSWSFEKMNNNINKKDLGSNPSAVESVFFSTQRFSKFFNI